MKTIRLSRRAVMLAVVLIAVAVERAAVWLLGMDRFLPGLEGGALLAWAIGHCDTLDGPVVAELADLAEAAGRVMGLGPNDLATLRQAALPYRQPN